MCTHTINTHTHTHTHTHPFTPMYIPENLGNWCAVPKKGMGRNSRNRSIGRTTQQKTNTHSVQYLCLAQVCAISTAIYSKLLVLEL